MREFEITYKNKRLSATKDKDGNYSVNIPSEDGCYTRILNTNVGWLFSTFNVEQDYFFEVWLRQDGKLGWRNDVDKKDHITTEAYDPITENVGNLNDVARELYSVVRQFYGYQKFGISPILVVDLKNDLAQISEALDGNTNISKQVKERVKSFAPFIQGGLKSDKTEGVGFSIPEGFSREEFLREYQKMLSIRKKYEHLLTRERTEKEVEHK